MRSSCDQDVPKIHGMFSQSLSQNFPGELIFLRHGETDWNRDGKVMGQQDIALNETGVGQAQKAVQLLENFAISHLYTSPLKRCQATAQIIARALNLPVLTIPALRERCWGIFENGPPEARSVALNRPPNGETASEFNQRILIGLKQISSPAKPLVVSHSGVYRAMIGQDMNQKIGHAIPIVISSAERVNNFETVAFGL